MKLGLQRKKKRITGHSNSRPNDNRFDTFPVYPEQTVSIETWCPVYHQRLLQKKILKL